MGNSTCNGGTLPGARQHTYTSAPVNLVPCDSWTASWSSVNEGQRNAAVLNLVNPASQSMFFTTTVNTQAAQRATTVQWCRARRSPTYASTHR